MGLFKYTFLSTLLNNCRKNTLNLYFNQLYIFEKCRRVGNPDHLNRISLIKSAGVYKVPNSPLPPAGESLLSLLGKNKVVKGRVSWLWGMIKLGIGKGKQYNLPYHIKIFGKNIKWGRWKWDGNLGKKIKMQKQLGLGIISS